MKFNTLISLIFLVLVGCAEESSRKILTCEYSQGDSDWLRIIYVFDTADFDGENKLAETYTIEEMYSEERGPYSVTSETSIVRYEVTPTTLRFFGEFSSKSKADTILNRSTLALSTYHDEDDYDGLFVNEGCSLEDYGSGVRI